MEDVRNVVLIIAGVLASIKNIVELYDRLKKNKDDNKD